MKYLDTNLPKHVQDIYAEIYKMLMKEIRKDQSKLRYVLYSWFGRLKYSKGVNSSKIH